MAEHALLVTAAELPNYGLSSDFLAQFTADQIAAVLQSVTDEALSRIDPEYIQPLTAWGADLKGYVARIAVYELQSIVGMSPSTAAVADENLRMRAQQARDTLDRVGKGEIPLQGVIDSTGTTGTKILVGVKSDTPRNW